MRTKPEVDIAWKRRHRLSITARLQGSIHRRHFKAPLRTEAQIGRKLNCFSAAKPESEKPAVLLPFCRCTYACVRVTLSLIRIH